MKQKLVLHVCCAPDQAYVVKLLRDTHDLRCFFSNPNIQPQAEYEKRLKEANNVAKHYGVPLDAPDYELRLWENAVKGLEDTGEGGARCRQCFLLRFLQTAEFCKSIGWPSFTSTLSISPHKSMALLIETGRMAAKKYSVKYEEFNFKKQNGFKNSVVLSNGLGLYRQDYCGCRLSRNEAHERRTGTTNRK